MAGKNGRPPTRRLVPPNKLPDLLGTAEAALLLGVEKPRIGRYYKLRREGRGAKNFPLPVVKLGATPVWRKADLLAFKEGKAVRDPRPMALMGTAEAAELIGVERTRIGLWREKGRMPEPLVVLKATPVWRRSDIQKLANRVAKDRAERVAARETREAVAA